MGSNWELFKKRRLTKIMSCNKRPVDVVRTDEQMFSIILPFLCQLSSVLMLHLVAFPERLDVLYLVCQLL